MDKMVTDESLARINKGKPEREHMIPVINPNADRIKKRYLTRKNFEATARKKGWIELRPGQDISEVLTANRPLSPNEKVLMDQLRAAQDENQRLKNQPNGEAVTPPHIEPVIPPITPPGTTEPSIDFDFDRAIPLIERDINNIELISTLKEIQEAEAKGQNRKGVITATESRIKELEKPE